MKIKIYLNFLQTDKGESMTAKEIIKEILIKENLKLIDLAKMLNTSQPNLSQKLNTIKYNDMEIIAELLSYSIKWEKQNTNSTDIFNEFENELLHNFRKLSRDDKLKILGRIEEIASKSNEEMGKSYNSKSS